MPASTPEQAQCLSCGYSLAGLPTGACPECGRAFDLNDPFTFGPRNLARYRRWVASVPNAWVNAIYAAAMAMVLFITSSPEGSVSDFVGGMLSLMYIVVTVWWGIWLVVHLIGQIALRWERLPAPRWAVSWVYIPVILVAFHVLHGSGVVWHARWALARSSFTSLAATPPAQWQPGWYGTFHVTVIQPKADGTVVLDLGFPDCYSQGSAEFRYGGVTSPVSGPDVSLGGGWWITWNPT